MLIIIENEKFTTRSGVSRQGRPYTIHNQTALLKGDRVMGEIQLNLDDPPRPYAPGAYQIDLERSVTIGAYGRLQFNPVLVQQTASSHPENKTTNFPKMANS